MVRLRSKADAAFEEMKRRYSNAFDFLDAVLDKIELVIDELEGSGLFEPREGLVAGYDVVRRFTDDELRALIEAANSILAIE